MHINEYTLKAKRQKIQWQYPTFDFFISKNIIGNPYKTTVQTISNRNE
jgi:hypothetical protein